MALYKKTITLLITVLILCSTAKSQSYITNSHGSCISADLLMGMSQYRGEYHGFTNAISKLDMNFGYGLRVNYTLNNDYVPSKLNSALDRRFSVFVGINLFRFSSDSDIMKADLTGKITEFNAGLQVNIMKFSSNLATLGDCYRFTPYFLLGGALGLVKTKIPALNIEDSSPRAVPSFLIGGGLKFALKTGFVLGAEGGLRVTSTDDMDYSNTRSGNDMYYFIGVYTSFNLGELFIK